MNKVNFDCYLPFEGLSDLRTIRIYEPLSQHYLIPWYVIIAPLKDFPLQDNWQYQSQCEGEPRQLKLIKSTFRFIHSIRVIISWDENY